ncbi:basement membrane-specific heparan sulfate proteoglycan core protein-like [Chiloscyllium plagiosum]|uniref:basement membrane-specific heparan sulfate proteoglycan core protein-like n=1 Tax=Chiloscyllium plagiosum TaxID=36176 RepID=UPI001CB8592E|nr:basement membrane-specific heparan sulfate proteoglycan core protein-like [Chiloscyllium plagiosum]
MRNSTVAQTNVHWYKQEPGSHVKLFLSHNRNGYIRRSQGFNNRFQPSRHHYNNSFILTITNVQPSDTGVYYCLVWGNVLGEGSLVIVNRITGPVLIQSPILQRVTEGHTARLQCTMRNSAVTHTDVQWYRLSPEQIMERVSTHPGSGSTQWSPGFTERFQPFRDPSGVILTITNVQPSDTGVYYCSVWGWIYGKGSQLIVDSVSGPVLLQSPIMERVIEGYTAQLQCTMRNATVTHTDVRWYRQEPGSHVKLFFTRERKSYTQWSPAFTYRIWFSRDSSSNSVILTITNVQPSDTGVYYCTVQGRIYGRGSLLIVDNQIMERVLTDPGSGSTQWSPRFQPYRDSSSNSFILTITNEQPNDTGVYYCSVWGKIYGRGSQLIVDSITGPVLLQSPSLEHVTQDHTARFHCTMRNATVTHTDVHWYRLSAKKIMEWVLTHPESGSTEWSPGFTERFQHSRDPSSNSFILTITNVQFNDNGVYYCSVWGRIYGRGSQLNITNANVPVLLQSLSLERITKGHTGRLQCTVRNAAVTHTNVHWDWEKPGNKMEWVLTHDMRNITQWSPGFTERFQSSMDPSNNSFILTITNMQPSDAGVYYCKMWGDISGNGTQLTVTDPLADPVLIQDPVVSKVAEGETAEFQCAMHNASVIDTDVHWHYQRPGSNREWVISHFVNGTLTKAQGFHNHVQLSRNVSRNSYILRLVDVTLNDTAVYSCSVWSYISGAGSQLIVTEASSHKILWTSDPILIICTILGFAVLISIVLLTFFLRKQKLCSSVKDSTQGSPVEDQDIVYATVNDRTWSSEQAAVPPVVVAEGECHYAELHFHRQGSSQPSVTAAERISEYAVIKRARN